MESSRDSRAGRYLAEDHQSGGIRYTVITAANDRGVLYGAFALLRKIALGEPDRGPRRARIARTRLSAG